MQKERPGWQLNRAKSLKKPHQETAGETRRPRLLPQLRIKGSKDARRAYGPRWCAPTWVWYPPQQETPLRQELCRRGPLAVLDPGCAFRAGGSL